MQLPFGISKAFDRNAMGRWRSMVRRIESLEKSLRELDDEALRKKSLELKFDALSDRSLDDILPTAYALVREAGHRTLGMRHYPVQLLGGIAIHFGSIAVMQTGEGKTLTATLPMYLAALTGKGAHLATANDYLAARDAELMTPIYQALGLSVGVVTSESTRADRRRGYKSDITYTTAKEIGFDFLRDRLFQRQSEMGNSGMIAELVDDTAAAASQKAVQRGLNFMLVDEADSILIDEARTPLIVSSMPDEGVKAKLALYRWASEMAARYQQDEHYEADKKTKAVSLTGAGRRLARKLPKPDLLAQTPMLDIYEQAEQAIFVERNYVRDRQYVVRDGEIVIVDEFTGRLAEGRKWRAGLHQAIEAREDVEISIESGTAARITIQDLFLRYDRLSGMTGTAANSASELRKIYDVRVVNVPTNRPPQRKQWPDQVFGDEAQKWAAIVDEIEKLNQTGRPILVGTRSIDRSDLLSAELDKRNIVHDVLNARALAREAAIVEQAGQVGRVTVATNMAGRGTDIKVSDEALEMGGLHVICSELHESARIDRQLIGRCGRQGDPGSYRQFLSLEDEILANGLGHEPAMRLLKRKSEPSRSLARLAPLFRKAQGKVEYRHFQARKMLLHQDNIKQELQLEMGQDPYLDDAAA